MKNFFLCAINLFVTFATTAQSTSVNLPSEKLDSIVKAAAKVFTGDSARVGLSVGVLNGKTKYTYNFGETAPGSGSTPTDNTIYEIGSLTKTFTGLLMAHAITEGKLKLNDDVRKYLSANYRNLQYPNGDPVKVGYILAHTAQLPNSFSEAWNEQRTEAGFLQELRNIKLDTLRPFTYNYSNAGYQLMGYILEKLYGTSYENLVKQYITKPLKMHNTGIAFTSFVQQGISKGYNASHQVMPYMPVDFPSAGSMKSTIADMLSYMYYQLHSKDEAVQLTHRILYGNIDDNAHGFQWEIGKTWNWDYYFRGDGGTNGFRSFCVMYPDYGVGIILLSNEMDDNVGRNLYNLANSIFRGIKILKQ